jgi:hypothetical protein
LDGTPSGFLASSPSYRRAQIVGTRT